MNERIRLVREDQHLSQTAFGQRIGVSRDVINNLERGRVDIKDHIVKLLCDEFSVSELWLRTGDGEMYAQESTFSLDAYLKDRKASDLELEIVKAYFDMPPELRRAVINHFTVRLSGGRPDAPGEDAGAIDAETAYEKTLKSLRNTDSTISNTTADDSENDA